MRLSGFVTLNGVRTPLDWTITGTSVNAGPGLGADEVKVHVSLPDYSNSTGTSIMAEAIVVENVIQLLSQLIWIWGRAVDSSWRQNSKAGRPGKRQRGLPTEPDFR